MQTKKHLVLISIISCIYTDCYSQSGKDTIINIYFESDRFKLDSTQIREIKNFSSTFHINSIIGYADSNGTQDYNLELSKKRALAVFDVLSRESDSIDRKIMRFAGESTSEPELWKNRRVQIVAYQNSLTKKETEDRQVAFRSFDLEYVFFFPDQAIVTQESIPYIKELAEILKTYKTGTFEIIGHINYQSRLDSSHLTDLFQLSERRAKTIYDYLESYGISPSRMTYKGVGNSEPIYPSPINDEQRRKNMRVQIIIRK